MFAKVFASSRFSHFQKMESKVIDFSVDTIIQRIFIKTMPGKKTFLDSVDLQHIFGFMALNALKIFQPLRFFMIFNGSMQQLCIPILSIK